MTSASDDITGGLRQLIEESLPTAGDVEVGGLRRISEGFSRENWQFDAAWTDGQNRRSAELILRRDPVSSLLDTDRQLEFSLLRALQDTDVPTPGVLWIDADGGTVGRPSLVMERAVGECDWHVLNGERPLDTRVALAQAFLDLLVDVQAVDVRGSGLADVLDDPGPQAARHELSHWRRILDEAGVELTPEIEIAGEWLARRAPESDRTVLVHGDYKPGNVLLHENKISVLLDWELAHLGDPLEDLGWMTNPFRRREQQITGRWQTADIVAAYAKRSGHDVDELKLAWWNIFACYKSAVILNSGIGAFVRGEYDELIQAPVDLYRVMLQLINKYDAGELRAA